MESSLTTVSDRSSFSMPVNAEHKAEQPLHVVCTSQIET